MKKFLTLSVLVGMSSVAMAKLPAMNDEAKAKAAETTAKTAWSGKSDAYQLCKSQDKVASYYHQLPKAAGKSATATPACADPGAFAYTPVAGPVAKPIEASGAHSPAETAAAPPSTRQPDSTLNPVRKL